MIAYLSTRCLKLSAAWKEGQGIIPDSWDYDSYHSISAECVHSPLEWQKQGLQYTASGYGKKIPTEYKVKYNGRFYRVYCRIYSNSGTLYIVTKDMPATAYHKTITVQIEV